MIPSFELHNRFIWTSSESHNFFLWNQRNSTDSLQDIECPSLKEVAETEAATAEVKFDLHGPEDLLIWTTL